MDINKVTFGRVTHVYFGKVGCMCGCKGKYKYASGYRDHNVLCNGHASPAENEDDRKCMFVLRLIQAAALNEKFTVTYGDIPSDKEHWASYEDGKKSYTVYFREKAK